MWVLCVVRVRVRVRVCVRAWQTQALLPFIYRPPASGASAGSSGANDGAPTAPTPAHAGTSSGQGGSYSYSALVALERAGQGVRGAQTASPFASSDSVVSASVEPPPAPTAGGTHSHLSPPRPSMPLVSDGVGGGQTRARPVCAGCKGAFCVPCVPCEAGEGRL